MDSVTEILIVSLIIQDAEAILNRKKGKGRSDSLIPDDDFAVREQLANAKARLSFLEDCALAQSFDRAIRLDEDIMHRLRVIDQGEHDDHAAALAVSQGHPLPAPTASQRSLEEAVTVAVDPSIVSSGAGVKTPSLSLHTTRVTPSSTTAGPSNATRIECIICGDPVRTIGLGSFRAPCGHRYCRGCIVDLVEASTRDESLFPLRCCQRHLDIDLVDPFLSRKLLAHARTKFLEFGTPSSNRIYCTNARCAAFLGPAGEFRTDVVCDTCKAIVCSECKGPAHPNGACVENAATLEVRALALDQHWQTCPGCHAIVELNQGCFHITCRCRASFCYLCAAPWKTCGCRQWDEDRIVNAAERRVVNEFGARTAAAEPEVHAERVQQRIAELRVNHECVNHHWVYRHGGGHCDECNFTLPTFMMRCTNCQVLACKRCSRNRL